MWCTCRFFGLLSSRPIPLPFLVFGEAVLAILEFFQGVPPTFPLILQVWLRRPFFWLDLVRRSREPSSSCFTRSSWPPGRSSLWAELQTNIAFRLQSTRSSSKNLISCWKHFLSTRCARRIDVETSFAPGEAWVHVVWCLFCSCIGGIAWLACRPAFRIAGEAVAQHEPHESHEWHSFLWAFAIIRVNWSCLLVHLVRILCVVPKAGNSMPVTRGKKKKPPGKVRCSMESNVLLS